MRLLGLTKSSGGFRAVWMLAGLFAGLEARAQTTTPLTLDFDVNYDFTQTAVNYTGTGTIAPFGSATLNGMANNSSTITLTFTIASGDSFQVTSGGGTKNGSQCVLNATIAGGTGAFVDATGSMTLNYTCSNPDQLTGTFHTSGTGTVTTLHPVLGIETITSLQPPSILANSGDFALTVVGTGFTSTSLVKFKGTGVSTTVQSATSLLATVPGTLTASPGTAEVVVVDNGLLSNSVSLAINAPTPATGVSVVPSSLTFIYDQGDTAAPPAQYFSVMSSGGTGSVNYAIAASSDAHWVTAAAGKGVTPDVVTVTVPLQAISGLAAGSYPGSIVVTPRVASAPAMTVTATLKVVSPTAAQLSVSPETTIVSVAQGGPPVFRQFVMTNTGGGSIAVTVDPPDQGWIKLGMPPGNVTQASPGALVATIDPHGIAAGSHVGHFTVHGVAGQSIPVTITLQVSAQQQAILLPVSGLTFYAVSGGAAPAGQTITVGNAGQGTMSWTAAGQALTAGGWLPAVTPATGQSVGGGTSGTLTITAETIAANPQGLAAGKYYGTVTVTVPGGVAANSPQVISVLLNVLPVGSALPVEVKPAGFILQSDAGQTAATEHLALIRQFGDSVDYTCTVTLDQDSGWLGAGPPTGTIASTLPEGFLMHLDPKFTKLTAGVRSGALNLGFSDGTTKAVQVVSVVRAAGSTPTASQGAGIQPASIASCSGGLAPPVFNTPGNPFNAADGQHVLLKVEVQDACGHMLTDDPANGAIIVVNLTGTPYPCQSAEGAPTNTPNQCQLTLHYSAQDQLWETDWIAVAGTGVSVNAIATAGSGSSVFSAQSPHALVGTVTAAQANSEPRVDTVVNSASYVNNGLVAVGSFISIFGQRLAAGKQLSGLPFPPTLQKATVQLGGKALPLQYVSDTQINAVLPLTGVSTDATLSLTLQREGTIQGFHLNVTDVLPAIFTRNSTGKGAGAISNGRTGVPIDATHTVTGGDIVAIYCTGLGAVDHPPPDGQPAPVGTLARTLVTPVVTIGGKKATVQFSGLAPSLIGVYQVNAVVPAGIPAGASVPLVINMGDALSNTVTIAVH